MEAPLAGFVNSGAGYLGTHILLKLLGRQLDVLVLENFCNSSEMSLAQSTCCQIVPLRHDERYSRR